MKSSVSSRSSQTCFLGIDVGTGSARAGVFTARGTLLGTASQPIRMWRDQPDFVEQSAEDIWQACGQAVRTALAQAGVGAEHIAGIGFDATCSLVVLDSANQPVSVSPGGDDAQNVIVWMDHRAVAEADEINRRGHAVLRYVGGTISPEMQTPKLLWLKRHLPKAWKRAAKFFDLPDYLTFRATGDETRSLCSVVCKWTYLGHKGADGAGWDRSYFQQIGLGDLAAEDFVRIGRRIRPMGESIGAGLSAEVAREWGLRPGIAVGVSIIDAHAGGVGVLGMKLGGRSVREADFDHRLALIGGTSSCHMAVSKKARFIKGVWGPYASAMVPGFWLTEGGQSATGALIDHIIHTHAATAELRALAQEQKRSVYEVLNDRVAKLAKVARLPSPGLLTADLHLQGDFHGNRSPRADPTLKGVVSGLTLSATLDDLALLYLAAIQAVAYGTRHILEALNARGYDIRTVIACGGGIKNPLFLQEHANITGCTIVLPKVSEAVLLGSAVLGSVAAGCHSSVAAGMAAMSAPGRSIPPQKGKIAAFHERKYRVYHDLHQALLRSRRTMTF